LLFYGTGGAAYGRVEESVPGASAKTSDVGWAAGTGIQYALTPQWSIGLAMRAEEPRRQPALLLRLRSPHEGPAPL